MTNVLHAGEGTRLEFPGSTLVIKIGGARNGGDYTVIEYIAEPGDAGPVPHVHRDHEELFFVLEGAFEFILGDERRRLYAGDFVRVPPGMLHGFRNVGAERARWLGVASPSGLEHALAEMRDALAAGTLDPDALVALGERYDTEFRVDLAADARMR